MTRAFSRETLLVVMAATVLALAPLMIHTTSPVSACGEDGACGGYDAGSGGGTDLQQQAAGAFIILAADASGALITIGCMGCPAAEWYDWFVVAPATAFGIYLIWSGTAEAYYGGGGGGGSWGSPDYSYGGGGSW